MPQNLTDTATKGLAKKQCLDHAASFSLDHLNHINHEWVTDQQYGATSSGRRHQEPGSSPEVVSPADVSEPYMDFEDSA